MQQMRELGQTRNEVSATPMPFAYAPRQQSVGRALEFPSSLGLHGQTRYGKRFGEGSHH